MVFYYARELRLLAMRLGQSGARNRECSTVRCPSAATRKQAPILPVAGPERMTISDQVNIFGEDMKYPFAARDIEPTKGRGFLAPDCRVGLRTSRATEQGS